MKPLEELVKYFKNIWHVSAINQAAEEEKMLIFMHESNLTKSSRLPE